jgi:hypothetical protein
MRTAVSILSLALLSGVAVGQTAPVPSKATSATLPIDKAAEREKRVADAVENAVNALFEDLSKQQVFGKVTVRDLLIRTDSVDSFLATLRGADQIGGPRWVGEESVQVRLAVSGPVVVTSLVTIANDAKDRSPVKPDELTPLMAGWAGRTFSAVGVSTGPSQATPKVQVVQAGTPSTQPIYLPMNAPRWANQFMQADGKSATANTRLRAARAAEVDAVANLRKQVEALEITGGTLGELAKTDRQVEAAIERAIQRARLTKVDYLSNGGANVRASIDLNDLWREIDKAKENRIPIFQQR